MKLFLDDVREPHECVIYMHKRIGKHFKIYLQEWEVVKDYEEFTRAVRENIDKITHISFDHDLAAHYLVKEMTGYDCAAWMVDFYLENNTPLPVIFVHSMNPVGYQNIARLFN